MRAIRCREWGAPDVLRLEEAESPRLQRHQVRIRVRAAGVNFADSLMVGGTYQVKPAFPFTPGLEAAGEIVETGSAVDGLRAGQRALAVLRNGGGYAEEICSTPPRWCRSPMRWILSPLPPFRLPTAPRILR